MLMLEFTQTWNSNTNNNTTNNNTTNNNNAMCSLDVSNNNNNNNKKRWGIVCWPCVPPERHVRIVCIVFICSRLGSFFSSAQSCAAEPCFSLD